MSQASVFALNSCHVCFLHQMVQRIRVTYQKDCHPRIVFHKGLNVSLERSPNSQAQSVARRDLPR